MSTWAQQRLHRHPRVWALALVAVAVIAAACGGGDGGGSGGDGGADDPRLQQFDDQFTTANQAHVPTGQPVTYASTPPYGGPHWTQPLRCGIYDNEQTFEPLVHTMEHGAVVLYYQPLVFSADEIAQFRLLASRLLQDGRRFVLTPSTRIGQPLVLASWGRLLPLEQFEPDTIEAFLAAFEGDAPEDLRC